MFEGFLGILARDLRLAFRSRGELLHPLFFLLLVVTLFPLAVGASPDTLRTIAPGVIWVAALLAALLSLERLLRGDFDDGTLEQLALAPQPLSLLMLAKILAHWLVAGLPIALVSPVLAVLMHYPPAAIPALVATLLLGTPVLSAIGGVGMAVTVGSRRGGLLLPLLVLPLYVPVLVFGAGAADAAASALPVSGHLQLLAAMSLLALALAPWAVAAGARISLE